LCDFRGRSILVGLLKKKKNKKNKPRIRHDHFDRKLSGPTAQRGAIEQEFLTYFSKDAKGNF
jgi:hypothetical protein